MIVDDVAVQKAFGGQVLLIDKQPQFGPRFLGDLFCRRDTAIGVGRDEQHRKFIDRCLGEMPAMNLLYREFGISLGFARGNLAG